MKHLLDCFRRLPKRQTLLTANRLAESTSKFGSGTTKIALIGIANDHVVVDKTIDS